jgi:RNA polymerase sigma-70 factor, ECF subfamily
VKNLRNPIGTMELKQEQQLLRQMRAGDEVAFNALYVAHASHLYRFCLLRMRSSDLAADVVQETFMVLMSPNCGFDALKGSLAGYLFGVARNLALKQDVVQSRFVAIDAALNDEDEAPEIEESLWAQATASPEAKLATAQNNDAVKQAIQKIAPHYRDVLILYELHEFSYAEIAQICGIDIGTVRSRLSRARGHLVKLLASYQGA